MKTGIAVSFKDPDNQARLVKAQFATVRSHPQLKAMLEDCARKDVEENAALRKLQIAYESIAAATTADGIDTATRQTIEARLAADNATHELVKATRAFLIAGFELAGHDNAEALADMVDMEYIPDLKAKCLFGAGCLDFTRPPAGRN